MPHKRAKRSAREQQRKERGADLVPPGASNSTTLSTQGIPKSISRVLDVARVRAEYRQTKRARQLEDDGGNGDAPSGQRQETLSCRRRPGPVRRVLSRRASEKDSPRRTRSRYQKANQTHRCPPPLPEAPHVPAHWRSLMVSRVVDTMCERGTWDVAGSRVIGLWRRSPGPIDPDASKAADGAACVVPRTQRDCGLSVASLERWGAWTFDPAEGRISASPLAALQPIAPAVARETLRLPFTRVGPLVSGRTCCRAGFGNTVGLLAPADMVKEGD
ncbi:hypothetical protein EDB87DRAFT_1204468 [Lactarius vividus]|nr:hypothetical protein EDB87DRAFT_1204468 [Lactarius vividus]